MNMQHRFDAWWQARDGRERWMLGVMFVMLAGFIYWYGLLTPLRHLHESARTGYDRAAADASVVRTQAEELRDLRQRQAGSGLTAEALLRSAASAGVPVNRQRRNDAGALSIGIDLIQADALFTWLDTLRREHNASPTRLQIGKRNGALQVELAITVTDSAGRAP